MNYAQTKAPICRCKNELAAALQELDQARIKEFLRAKDCDWINFNINIPAASHMGSDEALRTLMTEAENVINSRPLTVESLSDPASPEPITPNHLLTLKSQLVLPLPFQQLDLYSRKRWRWVQHLVNQFWIRWRQEYLSLLHKKKET